MEIIMNRQFHFGTFHECAVTFIVSFTCTVICLPMGGAFITVAFD